MMFPSLTRRRFIRAATTLMGSVCAPSLLSFAAPAPQKRKILFFTKSSGFEHSVISYKNGTPSYAEKVLLGLAPENNWEFTFSKDGSLFSPEYLAAFDALFFYTTGDLCSPGTDKQPPMTPDGKQAFLDAIKGGKGFIGTHSASDTFHTKNEAKKGPDRYRNFGSDADPYVRMLGGEFIKHGDQQKARMRCTDSHFPGFSGLGDGFDSKEEWYSLKDFSEDLHVLLVQETDAMKGIEYQRPAYPATWARKHGEGHVFYTSMGHREDVWTNPIFQSVLAGGIHCACGDLDADLTPNLGQVAPGWAQNPPFPPPAPAPAAAPGPEAQAPK